MSKSRMLAAVAGARSRVIGRVAERVRDELAGVKVEPTEDGVVISAAGLWRRRIKDARLRGIAIVLKGLMR